jgi:hypothetical protein
MNHPLAVQKLNAPGDMQHNIPNLLTFHRRRLILDKTRRNSGLILPAINVVIQIQVAQFHINE